MRTQVSQVNYLEILEQAWQQHLAPRKPDAPTFISLFAGCGGSSLGYSMAGYRELLAVEWDKNAVATFKLNFPDVPVYHGDIHNLSVEQCLEMTGLQSGELDLLDGSPPCQGFSTAGKRKMEDKRNQLYMQYVRLLRGLQPKVFVMENVSGLVKGKMKLIFADIMKELKASGYDVRCKLLNAMYFNVPQSRQRLIWIGVRNGKKVSFPKAESKPIIVKDALENLEQSDNDIEPALLKPTWQMYRVLKGQEKKKHFGLVRICWNKPSNTIVKDAGNTATGIIHPGLDRRLTIREVKCLCSFPDVFNAGNGTFKEQWQILGNSVPPLFMRAIALHIKQTLLI